MMNVRWMRQLVDVVESGALPNAAREAVRRWGGADLVYGRSSANFIFRFSDGDQTRYLRLTPAAERSRAEVEAELAFIQHVGDAGLAVALPLPSRVGALIEEIERSAEIEGGFHAVVFVGLDGREYELDDLDGPHCREWGRTLARLHDASQTFPSHPARATWLATLHAARASLPATEDAAARVLKAGAAWLESLNTPPEEYGLLHGDFELDNLIWDMREQAQVLDFDSAIYAPYAVDIALALHDAWELETAQRDAVIAAFCAGYGEARALPAGVPDALPRLATLIRALKFAQVMAAYALPAGVAADPADPPWLAAMRARHQRWLDQQRAALAGSEGATPN
jgi:Ser/Thr protein kinase RdoA (MazF antagonist)